MQAQTDVGCCFSDTCYPKGGGVQYSAYKQGSSVGVMLLVAGWRPLRMLAAVKVVRSPRHERAHVQATSADSWRSLSTNQIVRSHPTNQGARADNMPRQHLLKAKIGDSAPNTPKCTLNMHKFSSTVNLKHVTCFNRLPKPFSDWLVCPARARPCSWLLKSYWSMWLVWVNSCKVPRLLSLTSLSITCAQQR